MPIEVALLEPQPAPFRKCPACLRPFQPFLRGQVQSPWRKFFRRPYCAVICAVCKEIVGYEKPMTKPPDDQPQDQPQQPQDPGQRRAIDKSPVVNDDAWPYQAMTTQDVDEIELEQFEIQLGKYIAEKKKPDETP